MVEIVQILAGGGFFYAPSQADLENPELRPYIENYVRGRPGVSAEERIALFKLAWDVTGSSFAGRVNQYVRFYSGDPVRNTAGYYLAYPKDELFAIVERALGRREGQPIPLSPTEPGVPTRRRPEPGCLAAPTPLPLSPARPVPRRRRSRPNQAPGIRGGWWRGPGRRCEVVGMPNAEWVPRERFHITHSAFRTRVGQDAAIWLTPRSSSFSSLSRLIIRKRMLPIMRRKAWASSPISSSRSMSTH